MTDINAIKARLRDAYCGSGDYDAALSDAANDLFALCAEVERLREHRESCTENLLKGYETGKTEERAAVVKWVREEIRNCALNSQIFWPTACVDEIERGEHRKEKE